jgi:DNA-binding GntR family transcriptional regulator
LTKVSIYDILVIYGTIYLSPNRGSAPSIWIVDPAATGLRSGAPALRELNRATSPLHSTVKITIMKVSLSDQAYEIIKNDIITCVLEPGEQIVQQQLAERHQFGMTPTREALQRLAQEGFVQPIPRFGYIVSPVTFSDVQEIYELRSILESAAARLAASRGTEEQLAEVARAADFTYVYKNRQSYSRFLAHNTDFHRSVAVLAGNRRLADQILKLLDEMTRIFHLGLDLRDSAEEMRVEHLALAEALCARNAHRAEQVVQSQIARSQQRVLEALTHRLGVVGRAVQVSAPASS